MGGGIMECDLLANGYAPRFHSITKDSSKAFTFDEMVIDIGTPQSYEEAQEQF